MIKTGHKATDVWMAKQAIWNHRDMWLAFGAGILFGVVLGAIII